MTTDRWDRHFLEMARVNSLMSKDPSTRVGSIIVNDDGIILGTGFNGFPRGIFDFPERLADREHKMKLMVHAEVNAVLGAGRIGVSVVGATMYTVCTDKSGALWGGPPCTRCAVECVQAGIRQIISYPAKLTPSRWREDLDFAKTVLYEAKINFREVPLPNEAAAQ
jgi:dCMP deaminase